MAKVTPGITLSRLRALAQLHRSGVEGAGDELLALARERTAEVAALLHFVPERLAETWQRHDFLPMILGAIDGVPRLVRTLRDQAQHDAATAMAVRLAETACPREGGTLALDVRLLGDALSLTPARILTLGNRGSVGAGKLRALLRDIRSLEAMAVLATHEHIVVTYRGHGCRGAVRLLLHPPVVDYEVLVIPLGLSMAPEAPPSASDDVIIAAPIQIRSELPPEREPEPSIDQPPREPPSRMPFLRLIFDVARDVLAGGAP